MRKDAITKKYSRKRAWRSVVTTLAAVVVFVTTYALIIPAITWEKTLICEIEEHVHTDNCYSSKGELKCGKQEHTHTDECFDAPKAAEPIYICRETEHTHTEDCYFSDGTLKCTLHEHVHTENCLFENRVILAPKLAVPGGSIPTDFYGADPATSDLKAQFTTDVAAGAVDNDGKVLVDKSVVTVGDDKFEVILSALGQSYVQKIALEDMVHPDVVMVVDISTSMVNNRAGTSGNTSRLAAVTDALNNAIARLLENDPQTRIGIVAYSNYAWDGSRNSDGSFNANGTGEKHFYLPLANYEYKGADYEYVHINKRTYNDQSGTTVNFNGDWHQIDFTENGSKTAADGAKYNVGTAVDSTTTTTIRGTFTQDGLLGGVRMFETIPEEDKANREPVLILITDGEPTRFSEREVYHTTAEENRKDDGSATNSTHCGYWTIRTAMYAKRTINAMYEAAGNGYGIMFDTMGPGVTKTYGQTVINPSSEMLEACRTSGTNTNAYRLYKDLVLDDNLKLSAEDIQYADFADYSIAGELTPQDVKDGMDIIIASIRKIPRPIVTHSTTEHFSIIDTNSLITFTDKLGKNTELSGMPTVSYGTKTFTASVRESGTLDHGDDYTSEFYGCPYTLYKFSGTVTEVSTNKVLDMSEILLYEITAKDGSTVMMWQFPDQLLPIVYHNPGPNALETTDDSFVMSEPLELHFNVVPKGGKSEPGETYYSNDPTEPTTCTYQIAEDNPYYNTKSDTEPPVYTPKDIAVTNKKSENVTETLPNSSDYTQTDLDMMVELGNNGKLETPLNLNVHKTWQDSETTHTPINVSLYANGEDTGKSVTLSDDNEWLGGFESLAKYDGTGKLIVYTMKENSVPEGYTVTGETDEPHEFTYTTGYLDVVPAKWETVTSLEAGSIYRIHFGRNSTTANVLIEDQWGNLASAGPSDNTSTKNEQWKVVSSNASLRLQNVSTNEYLNYSVNDDAISMSASQGGGAISLVSNTSGYRTYYRLKITRTQNRVTYTRYLTADPGVTNTQTDGAALTIEKLIPEVVTDTRKTTTTYGFEITNKPLELTLSAEKIWGEGTSGYEKEISLIIYKKSAAGTVTEVDTIKLNDENDWKATYTKAPVITTDKYYIAESDVGDFKVSYTGGDVKNITVGGKTFQAVEVDVQHAAEITVTNDMNSVILPATGGFGTLTIYGIGALIIMGVLIINCVLLHKRKSQQAF